VISHSCKICWLNLQPVGVPQPSKYVSGLRYNPSSCPQWLRWSRKTRSGVPLPQVRSELSTSRYEANDYTAVAGTIGREIHRKILLLTSTIFVTTLFLTSRDWVSSHSAQINFLLPKIHSPSLTAHTGCELDGRGLILDTGILILLFITTTRTVLGPPTSLCQQ
jgi:hypothetical protein